MLTRADEKTAAALAPLLARMPETTVRQSALLTAYGTGRSFFNVWVQNNFSAVVSRLENAFSIVDLGGLDAEEAAFFLDFNPYFRRLTGEFSTVTRISGLLGAHFALECINLMRFAGGAGRAADFLARVPKGPVSVERNPTLRAVFDVIAGVMPMGAEFSAWYADLNHRIRHGCARAYLLLCGGEPACACLVSAESGRAGLISGVATRPEFRTRGFASYLLTCACGDLARQGKIPVLECLDSLMPFYERLGFVKFCDAAELETADA